jgi:fibronectin type 3 domain-containing protein
MRKQIQILLLAVLILLFSGCGDKGYNIAGIKLPTFSEKRLDKSLPRVKNLKAVTSMTEVALEWTPLTDYKDIAGYRIFRSDNRGEYKLIATIPDRFRSHYTDRNLYQNVRYTYKISSYTNDNRVSLTSTAHAAKTKRRISPPILLSVSKNLPNRIKLIWRPHSDRATSSYIIERMEVGLKGYESIVSLDDRLTVEYIDKDIKPAQRYKYRIRARSFNGVISAPSKSMEGYSKKLPNAIKWVKATDNLARRIDIIWKDTNTPGTIDHYNIYSSHLKDTLFTLLGSTKETKFTDRFDSDGVTRYYKITAVDIDGLESTRGIISTLGMTVGASRGPVINEAIARDNSFYLRWSDPDGKARSYTVVKKYWDGWRARKIKITDFKSTSFTDTKIKPNVTYTYYVISVDKHGIESIPSREVSLSINSKQR